MRVRNTLILVGVALALLAFVLLVERRQPGTESADAEPMPTQVAPLLQFEAAQVRSVTITRASTGQRTELERSEDGQWYLLAPVADQANETEVSSMLQSWGFLQPSRELTGTTTLSEYGLVPPAVRVEVVLQDGTQYVVHLGEMNPTRSAYYAQVDGEQRAYLIPAYLGSQVERFLDEPPVRPTPTPAPTATAMSTP